MKAHAGITTAEYGLFTAFIAIVSIGALTYLGASFSEGYNNLKPMTKGAPLFSLLDPVPDAGNPFDPPTTFFGDGTTGSDYLSANWGNNEQMCFSDGTCIDIPVIEQNDIETTAINGGEVTSALAAAMADLYDELAADPTTPPDLLWAIKQLADQGFTIAGFQENVSEGMQAYFDSVIIDEGNVDSSVITDGSLDHLSNSVDTFDTMLSEFQGLLNMYSGVLPDGTGETVVFLSEQISTWGGGTPPLEFYKDNHEPDIYDPELAAQVLLNIGTNPEDLTEYYTGEMVEQNSNSICETIGVNNCA